MGEFLQTEVSDAPGALRFHARVAANVVGIVQRELALGEQQRAAHARRLRRLDVADERALAQAIRSGKLEGRYNEVLEVVAATVRDKLLVANPKYLDSR